MRLIILTGNGLEHRFVANALSRAFPGELRAIIVTKQGREPLWRQVRRSFRRYTVRELWSRAWRAAYVLLSRRSRSRLATFRRHFFPDGSLDWARGDLVRTVPSHNGEECRRILHELTPDVIAVYGTAIIKPPVIRLAGSAILNMHTGLSPLYRGADTIFWALHNEEPESVGVTIHGLDEGVDSGPIVRTGRPIIAPDDDEDSLFCKCVILGATLYEQAIREVATAKPQYPAQDLREGREYRFVDRTVAAERRVRRLLRLGLLRRFAEVHH